MSLYRPNNSPYWHFDFVIRGARFHGSTGTASRRAAEAIEAKQRTAAAESGAIKRRRPLTLDEAASRYYRECGQHQASHKTVDYQLANLCTDLGKHTLLSDIDGTALTEYVARRRATVSNASVNREVELLRRVMKRAAKVWKCDVGELPDWGEILLPEPKGRVRELSAAEERRLFAELRADFHPLVRFCILTGIRQMNAISLTWPQVDLEAGVIRLMTKGGVPRQVPITPTLAALLSTERDRHKIRVFTYVCAKSRGGRKRGLRYPFTKSGWRRAWKGALESAGVQDFRFHDTRHTAATRVLRASGNLKAVQDMLGHENITTTARYAHAMLKDVRAAMDAAHSRNSPEIVLAANDNPLQGNAD